MISNTIYDRLGKPCLVKSRVRLGAFGGQKLRTIGKHSLCSHGNKYWPIEFQVVNLEVPNILGFTTCLQLNLVKRVLRINKNECTTSTSTSNNDIFEQYSDVFTGLGCVKGVTHHIETDPVAKPVIHPPRRVSIALRQKVKNEPYGTSWSNRASSTTDRMGEQFSNSSQTKRKNTTVHRPEKFKLCH